MIGARQDAWSWCVANPDATNELRATLKAAPDIARALGRLSLNRGGPRDLAAIRDGLSAAAAVADILQDPLPVALSDVRSAVPSVRWIATELTRALAEQTPARLEDGGVIRLGFDGELDAHRALRDESRRVLIALQLDFAQRYGVASLKIRHHAQLGYVIEAPAASVEKLRGFPELTLRQGMANGARFTTPDLSDLDQRIREAGKRSRTRAGGVQPPRAAGPGACRSSGRVCGRAFISGCDAIGREAGGGRHMGPAIV